MFKNPFFGIRDFEDFSIEDLYFYDIDKGQHERYPGTHGYRGTGRYASKF